MNCCILSQLGEFVDGDGEQEDGISPGDRDKGRKPCLRGETPQLFQQQLSPFWSSLRRGRLAQVEIVPVIVETLCPGASLVEIHPHSESLLLADQQEVAVAALPDRRVPDPG